MTWQNAFGNLHDSVAGYFGEIIDYLSADGGTATNDIEDCVVDYEVGHGMAMVDIPTASVAAPEIGAKLTLADASEWYIYDTEQPQYSRTACDAREASYWRTVIVQQKTGGAWTNFITGLVMYVDKTQVFEGVDPVEGNIQALFNARCRYLSTITEKMRIIDGSNTYYIEGVVEDVTASRYLDLNLREYNG